MLENVQGLFSHIYFPGGSEVKASACNAGDLGSIPGSGRFPGERNGNPLHCSCLEKPVEEEPGGLRSMGSQKVRHDLVTEHKVWLNIPISFQVLV